MSDYKLKNGLYPALQNHLLYGGAAGEPGHGEYRISNLKQRGSKVSGEIEDALGSKHQFTGTVDKQTAHLTIKDGGIAPSIGFGRIVDAQLDLRLMDHESYFGSKLPQQNPYSPPNENVKDGLECKLKPGVYPELTYFETKGGGRVVRAEVEVLEVREVGVREADKTGPFSGPKYNKHIVEGKIRGPTIDGVASFTGQTWYNDAFCGASLDVKGIGPGTYNESTGDYTAWGGVNENLQLRLGHRDAPPPQKNPYFPEGQDPGKVVNPGLEKK